GHGSGVRDMEPPARSRHGAGRPSGCGHGPRRRALTAIRRPAARGSLCGARCRRARVRHASRGIGGATVRARHLQRGHHARARGGVVRRPHRGGGGGAAPRPQQRRRPGLPAVRGGPERARAGAAAPPMNASDLLAVTIDSFGGPLVPPAVSLGVALILLLLERRVDPTAGSIAPFAVLPPLAAVVAAPAGSTVAQVPLVVALVVAMLARNRLDLLHSECGVKLLWVLGPAIALSWAGTELLTLATGT